ncbi:MAG: Mu transposase C-terminal domain-containing protein [Thiobacillus sp.]
MSRHTFQHNARVSIENNAYTLFGPNPAGTFSCIPAAGDTVLEFKRLDLENLFSTGRLNFVSEQTRSKKPRTVTTLADVALKHRATTLRRKKYLDMLEEAGCAAYSPSETLKYFINMIASRIGDNRPPSVISVYRWHKNRMRGRRGVAAQIGRDAAKGAGGRPRLPEEVVQVINDVIDVLYLDSREPGPDCHREMKRRLEFLNRDRMPDEQLPAPSISTFYRHIKMRDAYEVAVARFGEREARIRFRMTGLGPQTSRILERVEIDHTPLDLFVVDEETGLPLGRPWLTLLIDKYSRVILGFHISFGHPSIDSVMRALRHAILPKTGIRDKYKRLKNDWPCHGLFETLVVDNGKEFHAKALEDAAYDLDFSILYCPVRTPWAKGSIERVIKTYNYTLNHTLPGTSFASLWDRWGYDPLKHALITRQALQEILHIWIVDYYHQKLHRGLRDIPIKVWEKSAQVHPPLLPEDVDKLSVYLGVPFERKVWHYGIQLHDTEHYNSTDLQSLRMQYGERLKVDLKVDPDDLTVIHVRHPETEEYFPVPNTNSKNVRGLTLSQLKLINSYRKQIQKDEERDISLADARNEIRAVLEKLMTSKKLRDRKSAAKHAHPETGEFFNSVEIDGTQSPAADMDFDDMSDDDDDVPSFNSWSASL